MGLWNSKERVNSLEIITLQVGSEIGCYDVNVITKLKQMKIWGRYSGKGKKRGVRTIPMIYVSELMLGLSDCKLIKIENQSSLISRNEKRIAACLFLTSRGYWLMDGFSYGGDWVLYNSDPNTCHSSFLVVFCDSIPSSLRVVGLSRLAQSVNKSLLLISVVTSESGNASRMPTQFPPSPGGISYHINDYLKSLLESLSLRIEILIISYERGM